MKNTIKKNKKAFTLTELLVVIAILAILATFSIVGYTVFIDQAHQSIALQEMTQIRDALFNQDVINGDDFNLSDGISEEGYLLNNSDGSLWSEAQAVEEFVATLGMNGIFKVENGFCYYSPAGKNATAKLNVVTGEITTTSGALQGPQYTPNHVHRYLTVTTAPTCTSFGYTTNTCYACNSSFANNYVAATGHAMQGGNSCSICGKGVSEGLMFEAIDENSYAVVGRGSCVDSDVVIPSTHDGKPVVSIGQQAFENDTLQNVTIPNSVTSIGAQAFTGCASLQSITIPNSVTDLDYGVFNSCVALITVALPNGIESIPMATFVQCSNLQNVTIPNGVTSIGNAAFSDCTKLQSITIPQGVTTISSEAFRDCESLKSVTIPSSLDIIFSNAFYGCSQLQNVYISDLSAWCHISNIYNLMGFGSSDKKLYLNNQLITELIIPNDVTTIELYAFRNCKSIISVTLPEGLKSIRSDLIFGTFEGCDRLVEVYNQSAYITVEKGSFNNGYVGMYALSVTNRGEQFTSKLSNDNGFVIHTDGEQKVLVAYVGAKTNLVVPSYVTQINQSAFYNCQGIKSITIPNSVTSIGESAFYGCSDLIYITIPKGVTTIGDSAFRNCSSLQSITIPNSVTSIGFFAFENCSSLQSITIPNSVTSIGLYAFQNCTNLSSVVLGDQITSIFNDAFEGCENLQYNVKDDLKYLGNEKNPYLYLFGATTQDLTTAVVDKNCKYIVASAFYGCQSLTSVELGNKLTSIPYSAFYNCSSLQSITIPSSVTTIGFSAFENCSSLQSITIPNSVTTIEYGAFRNCSSLQSITIPNSVTSIGSGAFENCTNLSSVVIGSQIDGIGVGTFVGCENLQYNVKGDLKYLGNEKNPYLYLFGATTQDLTTAVVDENCKYMVGSAFRDCKSLTSVELSNNLTSIPSLAFYNCSSLQSITIPNSVTTIGNSAFNGCSRLTNITIPDSVTSIDDGAFSNCINLTSVVLGDQITSISGSPFEGCEYLRYNVKGDLKYLGNESNPYLYLLGVTSKYITSAVMDENCICMAEGAFADCHYLTSVELSNNLTSIPRKAFSNCTSLQSITIPNSVTTIDVLSFEDCTSLQSITIPNSVTTIGYLAFYGCSSLESVTFADPNGWYASITETSTTAEQLYLTDPAKNATYLTNDYLYDNWYKK